MALTVCGKILGGFLFDCNNPIVPGIDDVIYLYNKNDVTFTYSATDSQVITGISLAAGTSGHAFQGVNNIFSASLKLVQTDAGARYEHEVDFKIIGNTAKVKAQLRQMAFGRLIAIVKNLSMAGDAQFEVYGAGMGLILGDMTRSTADENNSGAYVLKLTKPKNLREPAPPATVQMQLAGVYDYPTTLTGILATIPAPIGTSTVVEP